MISVRWLDNPVKAISHVDWGCAFDITPACVRPFSQVFLSAQSSPMLEACVRVLLEIVPHFVSPGAASSEKRLQSSRSRRSLGVSIQVNQ